jgi:A/G-specific adenine glycosylase
MLKQLHDRLNIWYQKHGRHALPWRNTTDAYPIWVSEIMLQQTQVKTVLERFYFPFLKAFPTLSDLAAADLDDVLKQWEGLGYYTRARNLHKAAKLAAPTLPVTVCELVTLPGIGQSTAHAIAAFAYHTPVPIMDANVKRILFRFFGLRKATDKLLWEKAHALFDTERPFDYNQAMMDLGATVCLVKNPLCEMCPFENMCQGKDAPEQYPTKVKKKPIPTRHKHIIIYRHRNRYALWQRQGHFLHGLWGFKELDETPACMNVESLGSISHQYSHFKLNAEVYLCHAAPDEACDWFTREEINALALSGADHKAVHLLGVKPPQ